MYLYFTTASPVTKLIANDLSASSLKYSDQHTNHLMYREKPTSSGADIKLKLQQQKSYYKASALAHVTNLKPVIPLPSATPSLPPPTAPQQVMTIEKEPIIIRYTPMIINTPDSVRVPLSSSTTPAPPPAKQIYSPKFVTILENDSNIERPHEYPYPTSTTTEAPPVIVQSKYIMPTISTTTPAVSTFHPTLSYYMQSQPKYFVHSTKAALFKPSKRYKSHSSTQTTTSKPYVTVAVEPGDDAPAGISGESLSNLLKRLQESNHLPETLTPDNIDNSIRTLVKILNNLKKNKNAYKVTQEPVTVQEPSNDYDYKYYDDLGKNSLSLLFNNQHFKSLGGFLSYMTVF